MTYPLRHSHVAVRGSLASLAEAVPSDISHGEDDFGPYDFFDLIIFNTEEGGAQRIRFAAHVCDEMVHVLAENIHKMDDLACALAAAGVADDADISISTDQNGKALRSRDELRDRLAVATRASAHVVHGYVDPGLTTAVIYDRSTGEGSSAGDALMALASGRKRK